MKQLYYSLRYLFHKKGNSIIKIISLSFGLLVGIILFARVAFEMSFDKYYEDHEKLYRIMALYTIGGEDWNPIPVVHAPMPGAFNAEIPEIKYATVTGHSSETVLLYDDKKFTPKVLATDSLFFKTMGIRVLQGDESTLSIRTTLFLSVEMAKRIFGNEDPIGKVLRGDMNTMYTVQGVFEDIPENSHIRFDAVGSLGTDFGPQYWNGGDGYRGYVRLHDNVSPSVVDDKLMPVVRGHRDEDARIARGTKTDYFLQPVVETHSGDGNVKRMCLVLSLLALSILIVATMNYILISISSLTNRAKAIGIYKCNGASAGRIFNMFMSETAIMISISFFLSLLLLLAFRGKIEEITNTSFGGLFSVANLWIPLALVAVIFLVAGYAPARILSTIPVTHVFRAVSMNKKYWKRVLLFIQFSGVTFIMVLLTVVLFQYRMLMNKDLGYNPDGIVYTYLNIPGEDKEEWERNVQACKQEFLRIPYVTQAANNYYDLTHNYNGMPVVDDDYNVLFTVRWTGVDYDYFPTMGIEFVLGENYNAPGQAVVNETFVRMMGWTDSPIGKTVYRAENISLGTIVGVVKDYPLASLYTAQAPMLAEGYRASHGHLTLRIADFNSAKLVELNEKLASMYPDQLREFTVMQNVLNDQYKSTRQFRDSVVYAFIVVFFIMLMGLVGYISDEVTRRSKEIAIRKVNGAMADNILFLLYKDISYLSLPAVVVGIVMAFFAGRKWLQDFAVKISLTPQLMMVGGVVILISIILIVTWRTWRVANENPVKSIKSE